MEELFAAQQQIMENMNQQLSNFKKDSPERKTADNIKRRLENIDHLWQEFHYNHMKLLEFDDNNHKYFQESRYDQFREFYNNTRLFIANYQPQTSSKSTTQILKPASLPASSLVSNTVASEIKIQGTNSKLDEMIKKQISNFKAFVRTVSTINLENIKERWEFQDTLSILQSRWLTIDSLHWEIDSELNGENKEYEITFTKHEQTYNSLKKEINNKMWSFSHREKSTPQMDIPTFSGNYHLWMSFKDLFLETIHNNTSLSKAQKMQFLKTKISGEAAKLIQHLTISSENYEVCWGILTHRFDNKKLIFTSHVNILMGLSIMQQQTSAYIKKIHDTTKECLYAIQNLGVDTSNWDSLLVHILSQKLDSETHKDYIDSLQNPRDLPSLDDFLNFLENKFISLESSRRKQEPKSSTSDLSNNKNQTYQNKSNNQGQNQSRKFINTSQKSTESKCLYCASNDHFIFHCNKFIESASENKRKFISKNSICENCLYKHNKPCTSVKRCRECNSSHNTLLHEAFAVKRNQTPVRVTSKPSESDNTDNKLKFQSNNNHVSQQNISEVLLSTALIKIQSLDGSYHIMRALIDQGSQSSLITENAAQILKIPRKHCKGVIYGVGSKESNCRGLINVNCLSMYNSFSFTTEVYIMRNLVNNLPNNSFPNPSWPCLASIQLADPTFYVSRPVDLLLGADVYSSILLNGVIRQDTITPVVAQQTQLGWILCGTVKSIQCNVVLNNLDEIKQFWESEDISSTPELSQEDEECIQYYRDTTVRSESGHYIVRLPLYQNIDEMLGESKYRAIAQFKQMEQKFKKHNNFSIQYKLFMKEYYELGHMRLSDNNTSLCCYLPHHGVERAESSTTKLRVVFNASSKTTTGISLNDMMKRGPNMQQDLFELILKWRQYKIGFTADVEKMFRCIILNKHDQKYQKIIWSEYPSEPLQEYQLTTLTYGMRASPFLAMETLKQLAKDEGHKYNLSPAKEVLENQFYMDDLIAGSHCEESAKQLIFDLNQLLLSGGFHLRKWNSNQPTLLSNIEPYQNNNFYFKQSESSKTLGLIWLPQTDNFTYNININDFSSKMTKRSLLSDISKIFDPLGWITPLSTKLKLLFQKLWLSNITWDDELPSDIICEWKNINQNLELINTLRIPRWLAGTKNASIELHGFCDASTRAHACVIYCKIANKYNNSKQQCITLVTAKSKIVSQQKSLSLPRLELCAATLLSKLMQKVLNCLSEYDIKLLAYTDSTATLGWIKGDPASWKVFVSNRVKYINNIIPRDCWYYVKTSENPADCASRGISADQLIHHELWWEGPKWLSTSQTPIYEPPVSYQNHLEEIKISKQSHVTIKQSNIISDLLNKHSNFMKVSRILAWIQRVFTRDYKQTYLTLSELKKSQYTLIKFVQEIEFKEEFISLRQDNKVQNRSQLSKLNPFIDKKGMLRVGGRLKHANIDDNMKYPLIIPHHSQLTNMLIDYAHKMTFHGGARLTLSWLRKQYWLIGGGRAVKKCLRLCVVCRRHDPVKHDQLMGDLPVARCNPTRPFYHTGIDYTGYVYVKSSKGRGIRSTKGYIALFVCMATKAIHLEIVSDLSSSAFLAALRRMAARRGAPSQIYSDNGTNFVGASNTLNAEYLNLKNLLNEEFHAALSEMEITWNFNAPLWPQSGGLWEAGVRSLKHHLRRVIGEQILTFEEFSTLLAQLEASLNTRPLCAISEDPDDINYLTPAHFLSSGPVLSIIETERDERTRWRLTQKIFGDIWKRWSEEYLAQLSSRSKWQQAKPNININDIVLIHNSNLPPGKWALGRVVELHPGSDGYVRVVSIKTQKNIIKRPIVKISKLPTQQNTESNPINENKQHNKLPSKKCNFIQNIIFYTLMLFNIFILCTPVYGSSGNYQKSTINHNKTIYFDKLFNINLIKDEWKLVTYYDIEPYWQGIEMLVKYINHSEKICNETLINQHCKVVLLQLQHSYKELEYYNNILLGHNEMHYIQKRGLINLVGNVAHSLFGVLDDQFAEKYENDIKMLRQNQNHLASLWKNQTSIVEAEYNLIKRMEGSIENQFKKFNQHLLHINQEIRPILEEDSNSIEFVISSIVTSNIIMNLKNTQNTILDLITDVSQGNLNYHLLTPNQLRNELSVISGQVKEWKLPINDIRVDLYKIYHLLKVKAKMTTNYLLFEISIPLITREQYDVYKLLKIPHQSGDIMISILPISNYVAINIERELYLPISELEIQNCLYYDIESQICAMHKPLYHMKKDQSLCQMESDTDMCKTETTKCVDVWTELHSVNTFFYFCCDVCTIRILCGNQVTSEDLSKAGIIQISNECIIKGESFTVFGKNQRKSNLKISAEIDHFEIPPINNILNISIPPIQTERDESQYVKSDMENIKKKIEEMKSDVALSDGINYHDIHHYTSIYILFTLAVLVSVVYIYRCARTRRLIRFNHSSNIPVSAPRPEPRQSVSSVIELDNLQRIQQSSSVNQLSDNYVPNQKRPINKETSPIFHGHIIN